MLRRRTGSARIIMHLLAALAISLVVNFSYLLLLVVEQGPEGGSRREAPERELIEYEGWFSPDPNGHGYLISVSDQGVDSLYVTSNRVSRFQLKQGDYLKVKAEPSECGLPRLKMVLECNSEPFDEASLYHRPSRILAIGVQLLFYMGLSFLVILLFNSGGEQRRSGFGRYIRLTLFSILLAAGFFMVAPVERWHTGELVLNFQNGNRMDYVVMLRITFTVVVSLLYGYLLIIFNRGQHIALENEHLKNENLTARYNMLVSQVNPHFFFNSLNSLTMLVRDGQQESALHYIDRLAYVFRYILQNGQATMVPLGEELRFAEAYSELFKMRYAEKLNFEFEIEAGAEGLLLPALSLQPLIENAVKHNTITRQQPLTITLSSEGEWLVVSNPRRPKLAPEPGTGIGLENLKKRWELISGLTIEIRTTEERFEVRLPLLKREH